MASAGGGGRGMSEKGITLKGWIQESIEGEQWKRKGDG
jgi:hypothetical protein